MFQLILGYTFATLTGLLALGAFVGIFINEAKRVGSAFIMFVMCAVLSVLFAWMAGI